MRFRCDLSRFLAANFEHARNVMQFGGDYSAKCVKNDLSAGSPEVAWYLFRAILFQQTWPCIVQPRKKRFKPPKKKNHQWSYKEEETLIELWPKYECLYKTTSQEYKLNHKRKAAVQEITLCINESCPSEERKSKNKSKNYTIV